MTPHCPRHFHIWPNLGGQSFHSLRGAVQRRSNSSNHCATWPDGESAGHMAERWSYGRTGLIWKNPGTALLFLADQFICSLPMFSEQSLGQLRSPKLLSYLHRRWGAAGLGLQPRRIQGFQGLALGISDVFTYFHERFQQRSW